MCTVCVGRGEEFQLSRDEAASSSLAAAVEVLARS